MKRALAAFLFMLAGLVSPAWATGEIHCTNGDKVSVDLLVGRLDVISIVRATVGVDGQNWSTQPEAVPGKPFTVGQAFADDKTLLVDFTDENVNEVIGRLRVFSAAEGDDYASGGVFTWKGAGAFVMDCSLRG